MELDKNKMCFVLENMPCGFVCHKVVNDSDGNPRDYIFLDVNPAFEEITGLKKSEITGKKLTEVLADNTELNFDWMSFYAKAALTGEKVFWEYNAGTTDCWYDVTAYTDKAGFFVTQFRDIKGQKKAADDLEKNRNRLHSLVNILLHKVRNEKEYLNHVLRELLAISESKYGYIYFYDEENKEFTLHAWSELAMRQCEITDRKTVYKLENTGIWGEAVRRRMPLIINDFQAAHPLKKGYPEGHVELIRFMTVPVFIDDRIVAVAGVANKKSDYNQTDTLNLTLLMESAWNVINRKNSEEELIQAHLRLLKLMDSIDALVIVLDMATGEVLYINTYGLKLNSGKNVVGRKCWEVFRNRSEPCLLCHREKLSDAADYPGSVYTCEYQDGKNGRWFKCIGRAIEWVDGRFVHLLIATDITGLKQNLAHLTASMQENAVLLHETHHRVKNNLAVIIALVEMQERLTDDDKTKYILRKLGSRVFTMALVHEKLYRSHNFSRINMQTYLQTLINHLLNFYPPEVRLKNFVKANLEMGMDKAVPTGLIVHELVSNALKHAFPADYYRDKSGEIGVILKLAGNIYKLKVYDNGIGFPQELNLESVSSIGLRIVRMLGEHQLRGRMQINRNRTGGGTEYILSFEANCGIEVKNGRKDNINS